MKIKKHPWIPGVLVGILGATLGSSLSADATPLEYTPVNGPNAGTPQQYHWLDIVVKDNKGNEQMGSISLPHTLLEKNPEGYTQGKKLQIALQLNGDQAGRANLHLPDGKLDVANFLSADLAKKFDISLEDVSSNSTGKPVEETT